MLMLVFVNVNVNVNVHVHSTSLACGPAALRTDESSSGFSPKLSGSRLRPMSTKFMIGISNCTTTIYTSAPLRHIMPLLKGWSAQILRLMVRSLEAAD